MATLHGENFHWTKLKLNNYPCPVCQSQASRVYHRYGEEYQYTLVQCNDCQMIYQNPRFEYNQEFLDWAYSWYGDRFIEETQKRKFESLVSDQAGYFEFKKNLIEAFCSKRPYHLLDVGCACGQFLSFFRNSPVFDIFS